MDLPERDQRYLEKKYAHLLNDGTEKHDRATQDEEAEKELEYRPRGILWLISCPYSYLILLYEYFSDPEEAKITNNILQYVVVGSLACAICILILFSILIELVFTDTLYVNNTLAKLLILIMIWCCKWCIFVFLYSLLCKGENEKKFRLVAQITLAIMFFGVGLGPIEQHFGSGDFVFMLIGIFVAYMCLFPRTRDAR